MDMHERCGTCGQTRRWHMDHGPHHEFNSENTQVKVPPPPAELASTMRLSGDIVLRLALLRAGVLTDLDLTEARLWVEKAAELGQAVVVRPALDGRSMNFAMMKPEDLVSEIIKESSDAATQVQGSS